MCAGWWHQLTMQIFLQFAMHKQVAAISSEGPKLPLYSGWPLPMRGLPSVWKPFLFHSSFPAVDCQLTLDTKECCRVSQIYCVSRKLLFVVAEKLDDGIFFSLYFWSRHLMFGREHLLVCLSTIINGNKVLSHSFLSFKETQAWLWTSFVS